MLIRELPNTPDDPLRALAELRAKECDPNQIIERISGSFGWGHTRERVSFWGDVIKGQHPPIPAESIEDLRRAGMMPEPEKVLPFLCNSIGVPCEKQCDKCEAEQGKTPPFYCENSESTAGPCARQCAECAVDERAAQRKPSITLSDYARMESEHEAITSPSHYKVCEGLEVVDMIRAVLTPEQFRGYCLGNLIKYRMRAGKKTMSPMEDLGKAHVNELWLAEMEVGEG
jgi:hypothetical protein